MKKFVVNREAVGQVVKTGCNIAAYALGTLLSCVSVKDVINIARYSGSVKYNTVIGAIMDSSMFPSDKHKAVMLVPKDGDAETYKAIIQVVNSTMFPSDKLKTIESILEK